tara:strand:- start:1281 stop:2000 length:720 start_codon:yes stop_codon:yes gene_type:complete
MTIIPAIDLKNGCCVRLLKGDFDNLTKYNNDPINQANIFLENNFNYLHVVDLDGAQTGKQLNISVIKELLQIPNLSLQVGGGIRKIRDALEMLEIGVSRIIIGTSIFSEGFLDGIRKNFDADQIVLALDFNEIEGTPYIYTHGWKDNSNVNLYDFISDNSFFNNFLATDISLDGVMKGPSINTYQKILNMFPSINLIASGGITSIDDVIKLKQINIKESIVGKAIYEKKISLSELRNDY